MPLIASHIFRSLAAVEAASHVNLYLLLDQNSSYQNHTNNHETSNIFGIPCSRGTLDFCDSGKEAMGLPIM